MHSINKFGEYNMSNLSVENVHRNIYYFFIEYASNLFIDSLLNIYWIIIAKFKLILFWQISTRK